MECHCDDTPITFHDTPLLFLLVLLVHVSKFNIHNTLMTLLLRLALAACQSRVPISSVLRNTSCSLHLTAMRPCMQANRLPSRPMAGFHMHANMSMALVALSSFDCMHACGINSFPNTLQFMVKCMHELKFPNRQHSLFSCFLPIAEGDSTGRTIKLAAPGFVENTSSQISKFHCLI